MNQRQRGALVLPALLLLMAAAPGAAQEYRRRLFKPQDTFFYFQAALHAGYDTARPGEDAWGLASRGPLSQVSFEWLVKDETLMQRGWTPEVSPAAWNVKFALELRPQSGEPERAEMGFRLLDTWVQLATKWDRTNVAFGHRSIPYGHNPRIDTDLSFLPNQSGADLGFGTDTGIFVRTPLSEWADLELSATAGGTLSGFLATVRSEDGDLEVNGDLKYRDSWLVTARVGSPTFKPHEVGVFAAVGDLHASKGELTRIARLGADWVVKHRETWRVVNQVAVGENRKAGVEFPVYNLLNSLEWFTGPRLRLGVTNTVRYEELEAAEDTLRGTLFGMVSVLLTRDARLRVHPYVEYLDDTGECDEGVLLQVCTGCGLKK